MVKCRTCGDSYSEFGDGRDGECPTCADRTAAAAEDILQVTFSVDVLARRSDMEALLEHGSALEDVVYFITEGAGIGTMGYNSTVPVVVPPDTVEAKLVELGNDGSYFND
jgi:hypothetical protein